MHWPSKPCLVVCESAARTDRPKDWLAGWQIGLPKQAALGAQSPVGVLWPASSLWPAARPKGAKWPLEVADKAKCRLTMASLWLAGWLATGCPLEAAPFRHLD